MTKACIRNADPTVFVCEDLGCSSDKMLLIRANLPECSLSPVLDYQLMNRAHPRLIAPDNPGQHAVSDLACRRGLWRHILFESSFLVLESVAKVPGTTRLYAESLSPESPPVVARVLGIFRYRCE